MLKQLLSSLQSIANKAEWTENFDSYVAQVAHDDLLDYPKYYFDTHSATLSALQHTKEFVRDLAFDDELLFKLMCLYTQASNVEAHKEIKNMYKDFCAMNSDQ